MIYGSEAAKAWQLQQGSETAEDRGLPGGVLATKKAVENGPWMI